MQKKIIILVGSMSGTAEMVADEICDSPLVEESFSGCEIKKMDTVGPEVFDEDALFLICTSTYGTGELPDNASDFYSNLVAQKPDLSSVNFAVLGLGDSKYADTFCGGPKLIQTALNQLGANELRPMCVMDASSGEYPEEVACEWFEDGFS